MRDMIGIFSQTSDPNGSIVIPVHPDSRIRRGSRRVTRTKTLDGGVVLNDEGFSHGDRDLDIVTEYCESTWNVLWNLVQNHSQVIFTLFEGIFSGVIERIEEDEGLIRISVLIKEKLSI